MSEGSRPPIKLATSDLNSLWHTAMANAMILIDFFYGDPIGDNQGMQTAMATRQDPPPPPPTKRTGAPTLYREEYCEMMIAWFEDLASKVQPVADPAPDAKRSVGQVCGQIPTFERFASNIGVSVKCLGEWRNRHEAFGAAYARAKSIQADVFTQGLATGAMNPTGGIFVAKNVLGWRDRTEVETVTRVEDSESTSAMKAALEHATPGQLAELGALVRAMLANAPAIPSASIE